MKTIMYIFAR